MPDIVSFHALVPELRVDPSTTVGYISLQGAARTVGVTVQAISAAFIRGQDNPGKLVKALTAKGFEVSTFSASGIPDTALALILEHYAYEAGERCTEQAKGLIHSLNKVLPAFLLVN